MARDIYLALGDSITAGHGATHPRQSFTSYLSDFAQRQSFAQRTLVIAKNGWTTRDILRAAYSIPPPVWQQTQFLTLMAGGNDLRKLLRRTYLPFAGREISPDLVTRQVNEFTSWMDHLCAFIANQRIPRVVVATVYNPVPNYNVAVSALEAVNARTREVVRAYQFELADVYLSFQGHESDYIQGYRNGLLQDVLSPINRPIHPNNAGHRQIADVIQKTIERQKSSLNAERALRTRRTRPVRKRLFN